MDYQGVAGKKQLVIGTCELTNIRDREFPDSIPTGSALALEITLGAVSGKAVVWVGGIIYQNRARTPGWRGEKIASLEPAKAIGVLLINHKSPRRRPPHAGDAKSALKKEEPIADRHMDLHCARYSLQGKVYARISMRKAIRIPAVPNFAAARPRQMHWDPAHWKSAVFCRTINRCWELDLLRNIIAAIRVVKNRRRRRRRRRRRKTARNPNQRLRIL